MINKNAHGILSYTAWHALSGVPRWHQQMCQHVAGVSLTPALNHGAADDTRCTVSVILRVCVILNHTLDVSLFWDCLTLPWSLFVVADCLLKEQDVDVLQGMQKPGINKGVFKHKSKWCLWIESVGASSRLETVLDSHPYLNLKDGRHIVFAFQKVYVKLFFFCSSGDQCKRTLMNVLHTIT